MRSGTGRGGQIPTPAMLPGLGARRPTARFTDLLPRAQPALNASLAKGFAVNSRGEGPGVAGSSPRAPKSTKISPAQAREAHRCAVEGGRLIKSGRPAEAIALLQRSVKLNPSVAAYHHDLGFVLWLAERIQEAIEAFTAALRLDPRNESAHRSLGHIFDRLGHKEKAMVNFQAAIKLKPDLFAVQTRLGELYLERGLRVESATAFRAAAGATKDLVTGQIAEARALEASGALEDALAAMRVITEAHPDCAMAHSILGGMLGQTGHSTEAAAHYERAAELSPNMIVAWAGVAVNKKFTVDDGPMIVRMNATLARTDLALHVRQALYFALGKAHDDMGAYEAAMRNFEAGNRIRSQRARVDLDRLARHVDRLIEVDAAGLSRSPARSGCRGRDSGLDRWDAPLRDPPWSNRSCRAIRRWRREVNWSSGACATRPARTFGAWPRPRKRRGALPTIIWRRSGGSAPKRRGSPTRRSAIS